MSSNPALLNASALAQIPATSPPPGVRSDFNAPNPLSYTITTVASVFVGLTLLFLGIRTYAKIRIHCHWTWDDGSQPSAVVENEGFGRHLWDIRLSVLISEDFLKLSYVSSWLSNVANIFIKLTFFILYWSIFYPFRWLRYGILGGAAVVTGVYAAFIIIVELCVGIMITCVPTTSVFIRHILQPKGLLRSASSSIFERLRSHLTFTQQSSSQGKDANKGKSNESDGPYRHLKERGFAVNEDGVYNLKPYTDLRTETTITAQPSQECFKDGIHVHTDLEQA
ncbi:MAG: hypothetical protein Q9199_004122 [Rusavskia elegans]